MQYNFEWDPTKATSNANKHGVTFDQATEVFKALTIYDEDNSSSEEDRWITLGKANGQHYLVVVHTYRSQDSNAVTIRIIFARPATKHEIRQYEQG
jgi:uncharacterized DUF497 family protein